MGEQREGGDGGVHADALMTVGGVPSASGGVVSIQRDCELDLARALMLRHDYSQIAVLVGSRKLVGAITWKSMAIAALRDPGFTLADATGNARRVKADSDLLQMTSTIVDLGFVFVADSDKRVAGIVTTVDLVNHFGTLATPFLLIGRIESSLRRILTANFDPSELSQARDPADTGSTNGLASELTLGETLKLLETRQNWKRLGWPLDRAVFVKALEEVKQIRNDVMHFRAEPTADGRDATLQRFHRWLSVMEPSAVENGERAPQ